MALESCFSMLASSLAGADSVDARDAAGEHSFGALALTDGQPPAHPVGPVGAFIPRLEAASGPTRMVEPFADADGVWARCLLSGFARLTAAGHAANRPVKSPNIRSH